MKRVAVLVSGGGTNLQALLDSEARGENPNGRITLVVGSKPGVYALERAAKAGVEGCVVRRKDYASSEDFDAALLKTLKDHNIDLVVLAGYMRILSPAFVSHYQGRLLNIHPSLLPKYPGLHTHRQVLENGDEEHGTSVHFVTDELDGGPVILQAKVPVFAGDSEEEITARVQAQEHAIYPLVISWFVDGRLRMAGNHAWLDERQLPPQGYAADE